MLTARTATPISTVATANGGDVVSDESEPIPHLLDALASLLDRIVSRNDLLTLDDGAGTALDAFRATRPPSIGIGRYLERIYRFTRCGPACFVAAFIYVDRLVHRHPDALVVSRNVHRLVLASVLVASKVLEDVHYDNAFYARVGGVSNEELNRLELKLLFLLDFWVMVSSRVFDSYRMHLEKAMLFKDLVRKVDCPLLKSSNNSEVEELRTPSP